MGRDLDEYKRLMDKLAGLASSCVTAKKIRNEQTFLFDGEKRHYEILLSLNAEQRTAVADLLDEARSGGIHDALVLFEDNDCGLVSNGIKLPKQPFGTQSFYDFVCRLHGDEWPD